MRRLLIVAVVLTATMLLPAATVADSPHRVIVGSGGGINLELAPALACLGSEGSFDYDFSNFRGDHDAKVFETHTSQLAHVHGTFLAQARTDVGPNGNENPSIYTGTMELRVNDFVTPAGGIDLPEGVVPHTIAFDMVPVAGGPSVRLFAVIQTIVVWFPDGTVSVSPRLDSLVCA